MSVTIQLSESGALTSERQDTLWFWSLKFDDQTVLVEGFTKDGKPSAGYAATDAKEQRDAAYDAGKTPF